MQIHYARRKFVENLPRFEHENQTCRTEYAVVIQSGQSYRRISSRSKLDTTSHRRGRVIISDSGKKTVARQKPLLESRQRFSPHLVPAPVTYPCAHARVRVEWSFYFRWNPSRSNFYFATMPKGQKVPRASPLGKMYFRFGWSECWESWHQREQFAGCPQIRSY